MKLLGDCLLEVAERCRVAAGGALAVDRTEFSQQVTELVENTPGIIIRREEVRFVGKPARTPLPLWRPDRSQRENWPRILHGLPAGRSCLFYDAAAPIVTAESLNMDRIFAASRYGRGEADYLNCPFDKEGYEAFHAALQNAERAPLRRF